MMWRLASAAWLLALALPVPAQSNTRTGSGNTKVFVVLAKLDSELVDWFDHLSSSVNQIADQEDKRRIRVQLQHLQKSVYNVETDGHDLLMILQTKPLDDAKAQKTLMNTRSALFQLRDDLHTTGLMLLNQDRAGGAKAEQLIDNAMEGKTIWLSDVEKEIASRNVSNETIQEGNAVIQRQRTATVALGEVIQNMSD